MEIRLTRHAPTLSVAVSLAREGHDLPDDVRIVDEPVADAVEELVHRVGDELAGLDLDAIIREASRARL